MQPEPTFLQALAAWVLPIALPALLLYGIIWLRGGSKTEP